MLHDGTSNTSFTENDPDNSTFATWDFHCAQQTHPSMITHPSLKMRRGRYVELEFDVPGVVRTKRRRVDITLDFVTKEVAYAYAPTLREAKRITDTRYISTLYPLNSAN
jgi:hypothetical protein